MLLRQGTWETHLLVSQLHEETFQASTCAICGVGQLYAVRGGLVC